jgi:hypothetical protein
MHVCMMPKPCNWFWTRSFGWNHVMMLNCRWWSTDLAPDRLLHCPDWPGIQVYQWGGRGTQ